MELTGMLIKYSDKVLSVDKRSTIIQANAIIAEYRKDGFTLSLRQLYYQFVARGLIENTEKSYKNLGTVIADGRLTGRISWTSIEDRGRNLSAWSIEEDEEEVLNGIEHGLALDYWQRQGAYVEVWVEKDALSSVVERPCGEYRVPYLACKGYLSASEAWRAGQRFQRMREQGRDVHLIHLGDHDPSGIDMTRDNDDWVQLFSAFSDVEVHRIALNMDQVEQYNPPPNPAKTTDSRHADYVNKFGHISWELDALEPRVLYRLIEDKLREFIDQDKWDETVEEEAQRREVLSQFHSRFPEIRDYLARLEDYDG
jgi:hypothetical protein